MFRAKDLWSGLIFKATVRVSETQADTVTLPQARGRAVWEPRADGSPGENPASLGRKKAKLDVKM